MTNSPPASSTDPSPHPAPASDAAAAPGDASATSSAPLEYAPAPPVGQRRRSRFIAVGFVALVAVGLLAWSAGALKRRGWTAYVTREASDYAAAPGTVVYQDGPATARPLFRTQHQPPATPGAASAAATDPPVLGRLAGITADPRVFRLFAPRGARPEPLAFLHELRTPAGRPTLVALRLSGLTYYPADGGTLACTYRAMLLRPNGSAPPTFLSLSSGWGGVHLPTAAELNTGAAPAAPDRTTPPTPGPVRVFFGTPDPLDPSAFTVRYEVNGQTKQWRFRLLEKGLELEEQAPPGK